MSATTIAQLGGAGTAHVADLTDPGGDHRPCGTRSCARTGRPDVLVNAAGWDRIEPFMDNDDELWRT